MIVLDVCGRLRFVDGKCLFEADDGTIVEVPVAVTSLPIPSHLSDKTILHLEGQRIQVNVTFFDE